MPHIELAIAAQQMLKKANLTGAEVPVFVNIHNWLEAIREGHLVVVQAMRPEEVEPTRSERGETVAPEPVDHPTPK